MTGQVRTCGGAANASRSPSSRTVISPAPHSCTVTPGCFDTPPSERHAQHVPSVGWPANGSSPKASRSALGSRRRRWSAVERRSSPTGSSTTRSSPSPTRRSRRRQARRQAGCREMATRRTRRPGPSVASCRESDRSPRVTVPASRVCWSTAGPSAHSQWNSAWRFSTNARRASSLSAWRRIRCV